MGEWGGGGGGGRGMGAGMRVERQKETMSARDLNLWIYK